MFLPESSSSSGLMTMPGLRPGMPGCAALALWLALAACAAGLHVEQLRCEYLAGPLGIDTPQPRLSWISTAPATARGARQAAYQISVASSEAALRQGQADLWDSGKVDSDETAQLRYAGKPLASGQQAFWKVRVWDQAGVVSDSEPAGWEMGLLQASDWKAKWIARTTDTRSNPAPLLRRAFQLDGRIQRARVSICGLGYYELYLNGGKVGNHLLDPGYTRYDRRVLYVTYDVTDQLKSGANALGVMLGNGWFNCHTRAAWKFHEAPWRAAPKLLLQLRVDYADGRSETIVTDESWKCSTGAIVFDSIYGGETYDARLEKPGWATATYDDAGWDPVQRVDAPAGKLAAQMMPPITLDQTLKPATITEPKPGVFVVDVGQNLAGMAELHVTGPAGARVQMRYGERLLPDGSLDTRDIEQHVKKLGKEQQHQTDTYILKGGGTEEIYASRFTYHGFQYVEVTGFPGKPTLDNFRARFIHSAVPKAGAFTCSNPMLNRIQQAADWSFLSNLQGIPTDCPHREKNGWTGDAHLACEQAQFNFFPAPVHQKWLNDIGDEQKPTGQLPGTVPTAGFGYTWGNGPAWDSAFLLIPWYEYLYYGDTENFRRHYDGMKRYVDYLSTRAKDGIVNIGLNDWAPWKTQTDAAITDTAYYFVDAWIVARAAGVLGNKQDALKYTELAANIRAAFNRTFYQPDTALYDNGSQTALSCALYQGLVAPANQARVLANLVAAVEKADNHVDTGILGTKYLLNALLENGRADVAYRMVAQNDQPGWGWWLAQGATTLWEQWSGAESRNHIMFGDVSAWFYKALAGIQPDPLAPGFKHFLISPQVVGDLTAASGSYDSIRGRIVSSWQVAQGEFRLDLTIPANTTATVSLPIAGRVLEGGQPAGQADGVRFLRTEGGRSVFEVASGIYRFHGPLAP
ncbi:MAG: glycoside hydrolase family 78 protein [Verrucomicrobiota bacterium]